MKAVERREMFDSKPSVRTLNPNVTQTRRHLLNTRRVVRNALNMICVGWLSAKRHFVEFDVSDILIRLMLGVCLFDSISKHSGIFIFISVRLTDRTVRCFSPQHWPRDADTGTSGVSRPWVGRGML